MCHAYQNLIYCLWIFLLFAFFQNYLFQKFLSGTLSECLTVWILIRPDRMSGLICAKTVCKDYQQMTKVAAGRQRVINGKITVT